MLLEASYVGKGPFRPLIKMRRGGSTGPALAFIHKDSYATADEALEISTAWCRQAERSIEEGLYNTIGWEEL